MKYEDFTKIVYDKIKSYPKYWRKGQSVFNCIDTTFGVARDVQFKDKIDCFYNDANINNFIKASYKRLVCLSGNPDNIF